MTMTPTDIEKLKELATVERSNWAYADTILSIIAALEAKDAEIERHRQDIKNLNESRYAIQDRAEAAEADLKEAREGLELTLPYIVAANKADHLMDGFGPRTDQRSDGVLKTVRALLSKQDSGKESQ